MVKNEMTNGRAANRVKAHYSQTTHRYFPSWVNSYPKVAKKAKWRGKALLGENNGTRGRGGGTGNCVMVERAYMSSLSENIRAQLKVSKSSTTSVAV